jgi:hypothetical protein
MPTPTPRERLQDRIESRLLAQGFNSDRVHAMAVLSVEAFYAENQDDPNYALAAEEAVRILMDVMPPFVVHMRAAFEQVAQAFENVTRAAASAGPYVDLAQRLQRAEQNKMTPEFDSSGLPITDHPDEVELAGLVVDTGGPYRVLVPAEEETTSFLPTAHERIAPPEVIELTAREWHLGVARRLRQLGCTYSQLKAMHDNRDFATSQHHAAWFAFGDTVDDRQLDRANFVLENLERGDAFGIDMDDEAIARAEAHYPEDRLTGAPHHLLVNGDHSGCGCGGHLVECETWNDPTWKHAASICGIRRTNCRHTPAHAYREPCPNDYVDTLGGGGASA